VESLCAMQGMPQDVELERPMTPLDVTRPRFAEVKPTWCTGSRKWVKKMEYESTSTSSGSVRCAHAHTTWCWC